MSNIKTKEWLGVLSFSIIIVIITLIPYLIGYLNSTESQQFTGILNYWQADTHYHLGWAKQVQEGHVLLEGKFFGNEIKTRLVFNSLFLSIGLLARLFSISISSSFNIVRSISSLFLLLSVYYFASLFFEKIIWRWAVLVMVSISSGFGWLTMLGITGYHGFSDLWFIEAITFWSMRWEVVVPTTVFFLLLSFIMVIKYFESGKIRYSLLAGVSSFILGTIHPHDVITVYIVTFTFIIYNLIMIYKHSGKQNIELFYNEAKNCLRLLFYIILISAPILLYNFYIVIIEPSFYDYVSLFDPFKLNELLLGYGLITILSIIGMTITIYFKLNKFYFCLIWIIYSFIFIFIPIHPFHQVFLFHGVHIPLCILSVLTFSFIHEKFAFRKLWGNIVFVISIIILIALSSLTNIFQYIDEIQLLNNSPKLSFMHQDIKDALDWHSRNTTSYPDNRIYSPYYLDKDIINALKWLSENSISSDLVLSKPGMSIFIPDLAGNRVLLPLEDYPDFDKKLNDILWFFDFNQLKIPSDLIKYLKEKNVKYIFLDPTQSIKEKEIFEHQFLLTNKIFKNFSNDTVSIFEFNF